MVGILLGLILVPTSGATDSTSYEPQLVTAVSLVTGDAIVSWTSGTEAADSYRVYGFTEGAPVLIEEVDSTTHATAHGAFREFGVSGVKSGIESPIRTASEATDTCAEVRPYPPPPGYAVTCGDDVVWILRQIPWPL